MEYLPVIEIFDNKVFEFEQKSVLIALSQIEKNEVYTTDEVLKAISENNIKVEIVQFDTQLEEEIKKGINSPLSLLSHKEIFESFRTAVY